MKIENLVIQTRPKLSHKNTYAFIFGRHFKARAIFLPALCLALVLGAANLKTAYGGGSFSKMQRLFSSGGGHEVPTPFSWKSCREFAIGEEYWIQGTMISSNGHLYIRLKCDPSASNHYKPSHFENFLIDTRATPELIQWINRRIRIHVQVRSWVHPHYPTELITLETLNEQLK